MEKYRTALIRNIRKQLSGWFEGDQQVPNRDVYRFLHSIKGTAATIGLTTIDQAAAQLMESINEQDKRKWSKEELGQFLVRLVTIFYEEENSDGMDMLDLEIGVSRNATAPTILIIDDEIPLLMLLKDKLENQGWHVLATADPERAITFFYEYNPDCVVIDIYLKEKNGFGVLRILNHKLTEQFIPQIMISVDQTKEVRIKSYELGADDFIQKPFDIDEFIVRVRRQLNRKQQVDQLTMIDELSQVYNRKYFYTFYDRLCADLIRQKETFCLAMLDIDLFKLVNDRYGHVKGDEVIREFATCLKESSRKTDVVFRYGGEEFIILFPKTTAIEAKFVLTRILEAFSNIDFTHENQSFSVTFSAGIVEVTEGKIPVETWLSAADQGLYLSKQGGRNQINVWQIDNVWAIKTIKVAIVDDDPIIRTIIKDVFINMNKESQLRYDLSSFKSGLDLLESDWLDSEQGGVVILDGLMPDMDGNEVLMRIRAQDQSGKFKILMLTARQGEADIAYALKYGADDYMIKPFQIRMLESRVSRLVEKMG